MQKKESASSESPRKGRRGRPDFIPTPEQRGIVLASVGLGMTYDETCKLILNPDTGNPISKHTLIRAFREELDRAQAWVKMKVIGSLYKNATEHNNVAAQIFMAKTRYGWKGDDGDDQTEEVPVIDFENDKLEAARRVAFMLANGKKMLK